MHKQTKYPLHSIFVNVSSMQVLFANQERHQYHFLVGSVKFFFIILSMLRISAKIHFSLSRGMSFCESIHQFGEFYGILLYPLVKLRISAEITLVKPRDELL